MILYIYIYIYLITFFTLLPVTTLSASMLWKLNILIYCRVKAAARISKAVTSPNHVNTSCVCACCTANTSHPVIEVQQNTLSTVWMSKFSHLICLRPHRTSQQRQLCCSQVQVSVSWDGKKKKPNNKRNPFSSRQIQIRKSFVSFVFAINVTRGQRSNTAESLLLLLCLHRVTAGSRVAGV